MGQLVALHYPEFVDDDHARYIGLKKDKNGNWYLPEFTDSGSDFNRKYTQIIRLGHVRKVVPTKFKESSIRELLNKLDIIEQQNSP